MVSYKLCHRPWQQPAIHQYLEHEEKIDANVDIFFFHFNFRLLRKRKSDWDVSGQGSPLCPGNLATRSGSQWAGVWRVCLGKRSRESLATHLNALRSRASQEIVEDQVSACAPMLTAALFTRAGHGATSTSVGRWMHKEAVAQIHRGVFLSR